MKKLPAAQEAARLETALAKGHLSKESTHKRVGQLLQVLPRGGTAQSRLLALWRKTL